MSVKIRLARGGAKKRPFYRVVVAPSTSPRDGRYLEKLGTYNPMVPKDHPERLVLNMERIQYWLSTGAQPTDRVASFFAKAGLLSAPVRNNPEKALPRKKAQERMKMEAAAAEAAIEAANKAAENAKAEAEAAKAAAIEAAAAAASAAAAPADQDVPAADTAADNGAA